MPTLAQLTRVHSERLSAIARLRDQQLAAAASIRDGQLRAIPAAAKPYRAFDDELLAIAGREGAEQAKADAARAQALEAAHRSRRDADLAAFDKRRTAEDAAERKFLLAMTSIGTRPSGDAQRVRAEELDRARREFDEALDASQEKFRDAVDAALVSARRDASMAAADAERELARALDAIPAAAPVIAKWRESTSAIAADYRAAEGEEFARFHDELAALRR
jgi:hypothetical protein